MFSRIIRKVALREIKNKNNWVAIVSAVLDELNSYVDSPEEIVELASDINSFFNVPLLEEEEEQIIFVTILQNIAKLLRNARRRLENES